MALDAVDIAQALISYRSDSSQSNRPITEYVQGVVTDLQVSLKNNQQVHLGFGMRIVFSDSTL